MYKNVKNGKKGICPHCGSDNLEYEALEIDNDDAFYLVVCLKCEKDFRECYNLNFNAIMVLEKVDTDEN